MSYFFLMLLPLEDREEELRLEDRLTLEEELLELREEDTFDEELVLLLADTDLEAEREETDAELLEELRLTVDLGAGVLDVLVLAELILLVPPLWREEEDEREDETLLLADEVPVLDLEDLFKFEEVDG